MQFFFWQYQTRGNNSISFIDRKLIVFEYKSIPLSTIERKLPTHESKYYNEYPARNIINNIDLRTILHEINFSVVWNIIIDNWNYIISL